MKHIDEIYKEWCGQDHTTNSNIKVHDSSECQDFAESYFKEKMTELKTIFGQTISGTLYYQKVIKELPRKIGGKKYFLVENIETGFQQTICEVDLHCL